MDILKILEVSSLREPIDIRVPPSIVLGIGARHLTYVHHNGLALEFNLIQMHQVPRIIDTWQCSKHWPLCVLKSRQSLRLFRSVEAVVAAAQALHKTDKNFVIQKFIVTSRGVPKLIRVTVSGAQLKFMTLSAPSAPASDLETVKRLELHPDQEIFEVCPELFLVRDNANEAVAQSLSDVVLEKYSTALYRLVSTLLFELPVTSLDLHFLKDLRGTVFFLGVGRYSTQSMRVSESCVKPLKTIKPLPPKQLKKPATRTRHYSLTNVKANFAGQLKLARDSVVTPLVSRSKHTTLKFMNYASWMHRKHQPPTYLDKHFCRAVSRARAPSPTTIQEQLGELIGSLEVPTNTSQYKMALAKFMLASGLDRSQALSSNNLMAQSVHDSEDQLVRTFLDECSFKFDRIKRKIQDQKQGNQSFASDYLLP